MERTALVIGATGGVGSEVARALLAHGWLVRALNRNPAGAAPIPGIEWVAGDAMNAADVLTAAKGAQAIFHGANPPGYRNWGQLVLPMLDNTIAAARAVGARIVLPGTIYNFSPDGPFGLREDTPQTTTTVKGRIRIEMEARLKASGVPLLIVRAGDFFGPRTGNSWFAQGMVLPGKPVRFVLDPNRPGVGHAWAYLPDVAETVARLLDREADLAAFADFNFGGHWFDEGRDMARVIRDVSGKAGAPIVRFPWWLVRLTAPVIRLCREMAEMRYLWQVPMRLDNRKLVAFLGAEPHTPIAEAVGRSLEGLGCLEGRQYSEALRQLSN